MNAKLSGDSQSSGIDGTLTNCIMVKQKETNVESSLVSKLIELFYNYSDKEPYTLDLPGAL